MAVARQQVTAPLAAVIEGLRRDLGLTDGELATLLGVSPQTLDGWRSGAASPERSGLDRLRQIEDLNSRLQDTFEDDSVPRWLRGGSRYLGGRPPIALLLEGRFDRVHAALDALDAGVFI